MGNILIDGTLGRNTPDQLANSADINGSSIYAANLAALQGYTDLSVLTVGQWGTALDTGKKYVLTTKNTGSPTPHVWTEFSPSSTGADLTESTSAVLTINGGTGAVLGSGTSIQVKQASSSQDGYLSSTDWTTFNSKQDVITAYKESSNTTSDIFYAGLQIHVDGQTGFTTSHIPTSESVFLLWRNGQLQTSHGSDSAQYNYTRTGAVITWNNSGPGGSLLTDDELIVQYNALASGLDYEDSGNISCTWTAPSAVAPVTNIRVIRVGKSVRLTINGFIATANVAPGANYIISPIGIIPSRFRPSSTFIGKISVYTQPTVGGKVINVGSVIVESNGQLTITNDLVGNYLNPLNGYDFGICVGAKGAALSADSETIGWSLA